MQFCWRKNPRKRPSFNEITEFLLPSANQSFREVSYHLNKPLPLKKQHSMRRLLYGLKPINRLLVNDIKQYDMNDMKTIEEEQYCQMNPQIQRKNNYLTKEFKEQEMIQILKNWNEFNEMKLKNLDQIKDNLIIKEKPVTDDQNEVKQVLIQC